jgi:hypothetical protein
MLFFTAVNALLTAVPVAAFGLFGSSPGAITVQRSQLVVEESRYFTGRRRYHRVKALLSTLRIRKLI